ncbi:MAG: SagB/ThcOx family dehydrogenase, partial [Cyanobacteriota bacterium]|nr:SagB/ThcOx family dehydrogenase [Cyanobacteriota bacterium]
MRGLDSGVYCYNPQRHSVKILHQGDLRQPLARACLGQMFIADAPTVIVITGEYGRITDRYGERGMRYAHMECGHVGQNICLQAAVLGLGTVAIGAFRDQSVSETLNLP